MSSTSSSECECNEYWTNCDNVFNTNYRNAFGSNPYYPTMGQPLVYYAQAPLPRNLTHCGRDRERGSPNCFVKAFRWYTKEHVPHRSQSPVKHDMSGFAAWLDSKYDQFLQENQMGSDMYHVKLRQTFEAQRVPTNNNNCEPCADKRFPGKSPWKKKRRAKSSETAARKKSNQSCRYIMQPKDVSRPPSVCCHPSNATTLVSECPEKPLVKSQSFSNMTLVIKGKEPCNPTPAPSDVRDKPKSNECQNNTCKYISSKQSVEKVEVMTKNKATISQDFGCQFGEKITTKINAETQYDVALPTNNRHGSMPSNQLERLVNSCECPWPEKKIQRPASRATHDSTLCQPVLQCEFSPAECACKSLDTMPRRPMNRVNTSRHSQRSAKSKSYKNVECQCPEEKVVNVDVHTQYMPHPMGTNNVVCECNKQTQYVPHSTGLNNNTCECDFKVCFRDLCETSIVPCKVYHYRAINCPCAPAKEKSKKT